jgi:hypothetical protein
MRGGIDRTEEGVHLIQVHRPVALRSLPVESRRCTFKVVSPLETIVEDLKALPPARLEVAADFVQRLRRISEEDRQAIFTRTAEPSHRKKPTSWKG